MRIEEVKKSLGREVRFRDREGYTLTGCIIRFDKNKGSFFYQAELEDKRTNNSIVIARLEEIEICQR
ncbi:MAG: hypothetical protein IJ555_00585 [Ruminococcus sp.]|nr:hypothetical protein [Ruminococcus sp.]